MSSPENVAVEPFLGAVSAGFIVRAIAPHDVSLRLSLHRDCPWLDVDWTIESKKAEPWPEAGWLSFPVATSEPQFLLGRLGAPVDPSRDLVRSSNHEVFCVDTGVLVLGRDGAGLGLCPIEAPLVSVGAPGVFRFSRSFTDRQPSVFVNLFNNHWGTNFQQWIEGSWRSRVRLWAVTKGAAGTPALGLVVPGREARSPCLGSFARGGAGGLPLTHAGIELSQPGVVVTALGDSPDGGGTVLRLWEQVGYSGPCTIRLPRGLREVTAQLCDLRGRPSGGVLEVTNGRVEVVLRPFAPVSLLFEDRREPEEE
jgi:hypothetical protein